MTEVEFNFTCQRNTRKTLSAAQSLGLIISQFFLMIIKCVKKEAKTPIIKTLQALLMCSLETFRTWSETSIWKTKGLACGQSDREETLIYELHVTEQLWSSRDTTHVHFPCTWGFTLVMLTYDLIQQHDQRGAKYLFCPKAKSIKLVFVLKGFET